MVAFLALVRVIVKGALWNVGELAPGLARFHFVVGFELGPAGLLVSPKFGPNMFHVPARRCLIHPGGFGNVLPGLEADDSIPLVRVSLKPIVVVEMERGFFGMICLQNDNDLGRANGLVGWRAGWPYLRNPRYAHLVLMELGDDPSGNGFWREIGSDSHDLKGPVFILLPALVLGPNLVSVRDFN